MSKSAYHDSGRSYVTGSAEYVDDRPLVQGEVFVDVFYSPIAHGKIKNLDVSACLAMPEVLGVYTHKDLTHNLWGSIFHDQVFLAEDRVQFVGEPIAVIAATKRDVFHAAKAKIKLEIEELEPTLDLQKAIDAKFFIGPSRTINRGDVDSALASAPNKLKGDIEIAGQEHFYLESQASIAYPKEDGQIEVHSSSQHPTEVQHLIAEALGLRHHQVVCVVKRMGGAFGGKESQAAPFAVFASLVAQKLNRPARLILTKDDDMIMTGKRNPFKNFYEVGFDNTGKITALKAELFSDGGAYADLSTAIMERAMLHLDNAYFIPNFRVTGQVCKTHTAPNTAFRGFGGPKGVATIESIIEDIAVFLKKDSLEIRKLNTYQKDQTTPYGQKIEDTVLPQLFADIENQTQYRQWRTDVETHNAGNHSTFRGLSVTAVKFGISFTTRFLNQGSALVNVHLDGSIQVSTGATEMGQGVNIKIAQVVAECFSIPIEDVKVMTTSTEKIPNTSATAASSGSDINCQAALTAAQGIRERLAKVAKAMLERPKSWRGKPTAGAGTAPEIQTETVQGWETIEFQNGKVFDKSKPNETIPFSELVLEAYLNRQSLTQQGYFKYPGIFYNKETGQGNPFFYFTNGVAASEVSIDRWTGEVKVLRTEILMDLGRPINEAIDHGQVTGAFIQGMGWVTTENLFYKNGRLLANSPSTYKIPSIQDIPRVFNCKLMDNKLNTRNVRASKAVGEPPLLLAISVWSAVKNALSYYKPKTVSAVSSTPVKLKIPATQEQIYMKMKELTP
ncbi:MAG: molybdopterin-dependent oxidoreductase [Bdellovibrionaceae bacterium]|nr:molybdopterin-dependent oxidoreductase [Pseudobdellovibrionaceae bacterium]